LLDLSSHGLPLAEALDKSVRYLMTSSSQSLVVQAHQWNRERGQATLEFALISPVVFACAGLLMSTTVLCLQFLSLHDIARTATRAAVMAENPSQAAKDSVNNASIRVSVSEDLVNGTVTVTVTRVGGLWWVNRLLAKRAIGQSVTMMREAPILLR
jgi:Flp pilus assembly protein TadG